MLHTEHDRKKNEASRYIRGASQLVARRTRFELVTCGSVDRRSIHLSYRRLFKKQKVLSISN